ncbi:thiopeptide-type bacteriocin biosynthesis protein [Flavobacterium sp. N502540]|uniref:thiopeptide-type bacteriocin biosynthesis protein n=1 Tax=Flavobacterium sp. N502540 TaxID=2986838 RepID=UPI0022246C4F|nr:thiopeptide-type bacteriocin biosynthesis protein [Flavobacterium sp. N502540]
MSTVKRNFIIGDEWLYYKIYCGTYSSDQILINAIQIIVDKLFEKKIIDLWFFIRYKDPDNHLRVRFHLLNPDTILEVIQLFNFHFNKLITNNTVYDLTTATYKREIERYGEHTICDAEKMFYYHSKKTIELIDNTTSECDEIARIFSSLQMVNDLLVNFEIPLDIRLQFTEKMSAQFKLEHNVNKENSRKFSHLYTKYKTDISLFLSEEQDPEYLEGLHEITKIKKEEIQLVKKVLDKTSKNSSISALELITSLIHMNINRTFRSKQREYEMLCYDFMNRYYKFITYKK